MEFSPWRLHRSFSQPGSLDVSFNGRGIGLTALRSVAPTAGLFLAQSAKVFPFVRSFSRRIAANISG